MAGFNPSRTVAATRPVPVLPTQEHCCPLPAWPASRSHARIHLQASGPGFA